MGETWRGCLLSKGSLLGGVEERVVIIIITCTVSLDWGKNTNNNNGR